MAYISVTGEPGCRDLELARLMAQRLDCELVTEPDLAMSESMGVKGHVVAAFTGAELLVRDQPTVLRFHIAAPESIRIRNLMQDCHLDREHARARLRRLSTERATIRKLRFGQKLIRLTDFDLVLNAAQLTVQQMAEITLGLVPPVQTQVDRREFGHPSEEVFANILDFYGIAWDYEPRSFPLQWDKDGKVAEAFTPDFYLPEFDIYIELTTMKQAHVTKKNRKVRLLRAIYPHVNIQVFYQKDVQDLVMKYGLPERLAGEPAPTEHHQ